MVEAGERPIFVLGLHRGRTTLVQRALNCHSDAVIWGEHGGTINLYRQVVQRFEAAGCLVVDPGRYARFDDFAEKFIASPTWLTHEGYRDAIKTHLKGIFSPPGTPQRWGFKEIRYNNPDTMQFLRELFPGAKFVLLQRNALDTFKSAAYVPWSHLRGPEDLDKFATTYLRSYYRQIGAFERFSQAYPSSAQLFQVDDIDDPRQFVEAVLEFADLDPRRMNWRLVDVTFSTKAGSSQLGRFRRPNGQDFAEAEIEAAFHAALERQRAAAERQRARAATERKDWNDALRGWDEVRKAAPDQVGGFLGAGQALRELGRLDEAEARFAEASQRFPADRWAAYHYANMAAFRNDWEEAVRRWSSVRERCPDFSPAFVAGAEALLRQGRIDEAGALIEEAVKRFPGDRWVAELQARIATRQGKCDEALCTWTTVRERFPEFVPAIVGMADTLRIAGRYAEAEEILRDGMQRFPAEPVLAFRYAQLPANRGYWAEALDRWQVVKQKFASAKEVDEAIRRASAHVDSQTKAQRETA